MTGPLSDEFLYTAAQAERELGIPAATVRVWAFRERIWSRGIDRQGHPMYSGVELIRLHAQAPDQGDLPEGP